MANGTNKSGVSNMAKGKRQKSKAISKPKQYSINDKESIEDRLNYIVSLANDNNNGFHHELQINDWDKYGKSRTYYKIVTTRDNSKHYNERDYGYFDNKSGEYSKGKNSLDYDIGGNNKIK